MKILNVLALIAMVAVIDGCATGPDFNSYRAAIGSVQSNQARIWIYRPRVTFSTATEPDVYLNNVKIGRAVTGGCFYCDRPAGHYEVQCGTLRTDKAYLILTNNQVQYVRLRGAPGIGTLMAGIAVGHVVPETVTAEEAGPEIAKCRHYEQKNSE
jgi:hypothetical protein